MRFQDSAALLGKCSRHTLESSKLPRFVLLRASALGLNSPYNTLKSRVTCARAPETKLVSRHPSLEPVILASGVEPSAESRYFKRVREGISGTWPSLLFGNSSPPCMPIGSTPNPESHGVSCAERPLRNAMGTLLGWVREDEAQRRKKLVTSPRPPIAVVFGVSSALYMCTHFRFFTSSR